VVLIVLVAGLIILGLTSALLVDWAWFAALGYGQVFWTMLGAKVLLFGTVFVGSALLLWVNGAVAYRCARRRGYVRPMDFEWEALGRETFPELLERTRQRLPWPRLLTGGAGLLGLLMAAGEVSHWDMVLRFLYQVPYGHSEPLFGKDISFYLFSLPAYIALKHWLMWMLVLSGLVAGVVYWVHGGIVFEERRRSLSTAALRHGSALLGCYFAVKAWSYNLDRFLLLYGDNGVVVGASYTDVHVVLPVLWLLVGLALVAAVLAWVNMWIHTVRLPLTGVVVVFGSSILLSQIFPALFQRAVVTPNELQLEKPYLQHNITLTREAYNLQQITVKPFPAEQNLTFQALEANKPTIDNIRLWDWRPLIDTYRQVQEIRTYYTFHDVDIDRYVLDGTYQQVMLSARELQQALLPPNAQTWVNQHVLFTHGNGVVMSPVTRKDPEGLPILYLQDIPPIPTGGPPLRESRIYYGEESNNYLIVKSTTPEFDYPKGKENVYTRYDGTGGVPIGGLARRLLFAWYCKDVNLLLSHYITSDSRIMIHRTIQDRVRTIVPFLRLDHDPYVVLSAGRLLWMQDAYTTSRSFPYARSFPELKLNYIRNAVKVAIDAYNGTVDLYVVDPADPVAATYQRMFPRLFKPLAAMPPELQRHMRYPEDLFFIQAQVYQTYHMDTPEVFYNREDLWQFPRVQAAEQTATMDPYYIIMRLPGESEAELFLMLPMVPSKRDNMIAWLAARCDLPQYGKLIVYEFPKEKQVYGPFQIEARINQNTEISQQISLWNQAGSRVIRGNLLVIPIATSVLYVSPLYLRAEAGQLPELKRVIAAYGDRVVMEETLPGALRALFRETAPPALVAAARASPALAGSAVARAQEALNAYNQAMARLKAGDWGGFGAALDTLRRLLEELSHHPSGD
jgi:hypothetical protein